MGTELDLWVWARREATQALADAGLDDPHPGTVAEYAGKLRANVMIRGRDREAALRELRCTLGSSSRRDEP